MTDDFRTLPLRGWTIPARLFALLALVSSALCSLSAHAALGGNAASVAVDRTMLVTAGSASAASVATGASVAAASTQNGMLSASANSSDANSYTMQSLVDSGGTTIHEFLDSSGAVFAIAWSGPFMPDLSQLLGSYFTDYTNAVAAHQDSQSVRAPATVDNGELVVNAGGHMRAYRGVAYLKNHLPSGFTVDQIR